jgi:hypothetical protein
MRNISKANITVPARKVTRPTSVNYPKYFTTKVNNANSWSQATFKRSIGDLGKLFTKFRNSHRSSEQTMENWRTYFNTQRPGKLEEAIAKTSAKYLEVLQYDVDVDVLSQETLSNIATWMDALIIEKTFIGQMAQVETLSAFAQHNSMKITTATTEEDSMGIDGYVGSVSVSVKPESYRAIHKVRAQHEAYYKVEAGQLIITE